MAKFTHRILISNLFPTYFDSFRSPHQIIVGLPPLSLPFPLSRPILPGSCLLTRYTTHHTTHLAVEIESSRNHIAVAVIVCSHSSFCLRPKSITLKPPPDSTLLGRLHCEAGVHP